MKNIDKLIRYIYCGVVYRLNELCRRLRNAVRMRAVRRCFSQPNTAYLLFTPEYKNLGDQAIVEAIRQFLSERMPHRVVCEIPHSLCERYWTEIVHRLPSGAPIILPGGGNMGIEWFMEEQYRRRVLTDLKDRSVLIFPQTIYYGESERGTKEFENSKKIYNEHPCLTLVAREEVSYIIMKSAYLNAHVILSPDIVLCWKPPRTAIKKRTGILLCFRSDAESVLSASDRNEIFNTVKQLDQDVRFTETCYKKQINDRQRRPLLTRKMREFCSARLVVTDRLHGMIFAALAETPCVVLTNYNQKISGVYKWLEDLDYVHLSSSISDAIKIIPQFYEKTQCRFPRDSVLPKFDELSDALHFTAGGER